VGINFIDRVIELIKKAIHQEVKLLERFEKDIITLIKREKDRFDPYSYYESRGSKFKNRHIELSGVTSIHMQDALKEMAQDVTYNRVLDTVSGIVGSRFKIILKRVVDPSGSYIIASAVMIDKVNIVQDLAKKLKSEYLEDFSDIKLSKICQEVENKIEAKLNFIYS
jgi:hypothetical protein